MNEVNKIPVMLVDDSSIIRSILREVLNADAEIDAGAYASNGKLALPRIRHYKPRVIILDYEMPEMNGLETLEVIRREHPEIAVIMFSSHTLAGAKVTLQALELGAADFVPKPEFAGDLDPREYIRVNLVPKIKALAGRPQSFRSGAGSSKLKPGGANPSLSSSTTSSPGPSAGAGSSGSGTSSTSSSAGLIRKVPSTMALPGKFTLCAVGISTGGPVALKKLLALLPARLNGTLVITQHMPPLFTEQLALSLDRDSPLTVEEGKEGTPLKRGHVYIAPGGKHMLIKGSSDKAVIRLDDSPPYQHCKPSVNLMFDSLVGLMPRRTLTVIMTGMGSDGYEGIQKLHAAGSYVLAQTRESCVVYGMPAGPTEDGLASESHDVEGLAERITYYLGVA